MCNVKECTNILYSKGLCKRHYDKLRRNGDPLFERITFKGKPCSIGGCNKPIFNNKMCAMHNKRYQRHGDPNYINPKCNRDGKYLKKYFKPKVWPNLSDKTKVTKERA